MRSRWTILLLLGCWLLASPAAPAGVYNTGEPDEGPLDPNYLGKFRDTLLILRTIGASKVEVERPLRKRYLLQAEFFANVDVSKLSAEWKLNFSAVLIRRHRLPEAIGLLTPATRQHPDNFLLQSNLATAYHLSGDKNRARDTMKDCLGTWPKDWHELTEAQRALLMNMGWNEAPYGFYREVEGYYYKLLKLRSRESKTTDAEFEAVDSLFDVKFVGESGEFEPGKISKAEKLKLPRNAVEIVEQMLVWLPNDMRLYWLLGEVLNAQGDVKAARKIFDEIVYDQKVRAKTLMERRQILNNWAEPQDPPPFNSDEPPGQQVQTAVGFDWRGLAVAFVAGMIVAIFAHWQLREIRRRRQKI